MEFDINYAAAKVGYDAYFHALGGKYSASGLAMPSFDNLQQPYRDAWAVAANAVASHTLGGKIKKEDDPIPNPKGNVGT